MKLQICADCNEDRDKFRAWLAKEMTRAMILCDDEELLPDGKWHNRKARYPKGSA